MADPPRRQDPFVSCRSESLSMDHLQLTSRAPWETGTQPEVDLKYLENDRNGHALSAAQQLQSTHQQPNMNTTAKETKPRLGKDEVDLLEREFLKYHKPSTQTKRQFAHDMGVDLFRINNWFQNRRAKRKQEQKQIKYEQQAQEALDSEQDLELSSPDLYVANQYYINNNTRPTSSKQDTAASTHGSVYCPQFSDHLATRVESLLQTLHSEIEGGMTPSHSRRESQLAESKDIAEFCEDAFNTLTIRNSSELLDDIATLAGQTKVSPDEGSHVIHFLAGTHDKNMSTTTSCTPDETTASDSSTADPEESWELLPRCVYGGEEDEPQIKSQVLDPMRQALVERIMDGFGVLYDNNWTCKTTQRARNSPPTTKHTKHDGATGDGKLSLGSQSSCPKRRRSQDDGSADEDGNRRQRRQGRRPASELSDSPQFSCPFRKHDPQRYNIHSHRVCALTGWDTIARVKEHLYRNHKAAPYCKRCWKIFDTNELKDQHTTVPANKICEAVPGEPPEGVTPNQVSNLRSRAKPYSKLSESERWNEIFRLLFPGANIPSPYWEAVQEQVSVSPSSQVLMHYENYIHRELPGLVRARVEEFVRREMQPIEETIFANLELLVRECQTQLSSNYREEQPIELDISTKAPLATTPDVDESIKAAEEVERVEYPSADFSESVIQPSPVLDEEYVVDFFTSDLGHSDTIAPFNVQLDSAYVSIPRCSCKEECLCFTPTMYMEDSNIDVVGPILDGIPGDLESPANPDRWQDWTSADFEPRESAWR